MGRHVYIELPSQWEKEIALASGLKDESWHVLVVVPDHKTGNPPGLATQIVQDSTDGFTVKPILKVSKNLLEQLKYAQEPRSRIRVFADSRLTRGEREAVTRAARDLLGDA
jgi:hypothetical protein